MENPYGPWFLADAPVLDFSWIRFTLRPWHRDVIAGFGALCFILAGMFVSLALGFAVAGFELVLLAVLLVPPTGENDAN